MKVGIAFSFLLRSLPILDTLHISVTDYTRCVASQLPHWARKLINDPALPVEVPGAGRP